jgi:hypothetical protein
LCRQDESKQNIRVVRIVSGSSFLQRQFHPVIQCAALPSAWARCTQGLMHARSSQLVDESTQRNKNISSR